MDGAQMLRALTFRSIEEVRRAFVHIPDVRERRTLPRGVWAGRIFRLLPGLAR